MPIPDGSRLTAAPEADDTPRTVDTAEPAPAPGTSGSSSPYKNLFVPLVVVPALIVGVIVLVFALFGAISGREATLEENLDRVVQGGAGDHTQAAFNMVRQVVENRDAQSRGEEPPWPVGPEFLPKLRRAWEAAPKDEPLLRFVLVALLAQLGDPEGLPNLIALLDLSDAEDPEGRIRFHALASLGALGDERGLVPVRRVLETSADEGLRSVAAIALQGIGGEEARAALVGALDDRSFEVRANAAIGLASLGDPAGARVLRDLLDPSTYSGEQDRDQRKFELPRHVSAARVQAIEALARLRLSEDRAAIERIAAEEDVVAVREAAMRALEAWR